MCANYDDNDYFPLNYTDSRKRFVELAEHFVANQKKPADEGSKSQSEIEHWPIPSKVDNDLFVDCLYVKPTEAPKKLVVLTSGIHGSETYTGAAIQLMFLKELLPSFDCKNTGVLLVHSMNPFGFKHHHRCTEQNVNLNRNFSVSGKLYSKRNEAALRLQERIFSSKPVSSARNSFFETMRKEDGAVYFGDVSLDELTKLISPGQFEKPEYLEFGGKGPEPQTERLINKLRTLIPQFEDIIAFDLHTGLGHRGRLHLLLGGGHETMTQSLFDELFQPAADREIYEFTPPEAEGFYPVDGATNSAFGELAKSPQRVVALTLEFGTHGHDLEAQLAGLNNWIVCHQGYFFGYTTPELKDQVTRINFDRSFPDDVEWRRKVIAASRGLFERVFTRAGILIRDK